MQALQLERTCSDVEVSQVRPLSSDYLERLEAAGAAMSPAELKTVTTAHHIIAKLLAQGVRPIDVAGKTGFSQSTIYRLRRSPAFQNLELHYVQERQEATDDLLTRMEVVAFQLLDKIQAKLENDEEVEDTSIKDFTEILTKFTDRVGRGVVKKSETKTAVVHLTDDQLQRAKDRANARRFSQDNRGSPVGEDGSEGAVVVETISERIEVGGEEV